MGKAAIPACSADLQMGLDWCAKPAHRRLEWCKGELLTQKCVLCSYDLGVTGGVTAIVPFRESSSRV